MQVIDSANMLMVTGAISNASDRQLMIKKILAGQRLASLRLVRTDQVVRQFGPGLPEEHLDCCLRSLIYPACANSSIHLSLANLFSTSGT